MEVSIPLPLLENIFIKPIKLNEKIILEELSTNFIDLTSPLISPLTTAKYVDKNKTTISIRVVVFIDSKNEKEPEFGVHIGDIKDNVFEPAFYVFYNLDEKVKTENYTAWYFEATYNTNYIIKDDKIILYNLNTDPKTSRGTVTTVQPTVGSGDIPCQ